MKNVLAIVVFALFMGGAYFTYNTLAGKYEPNNELVEIQPREKTANAGLETAEPAASAEAVPEADVEAETENKKIKAPDFTVIDVDGNEVKLSDFLGTPVVLNFWASWCPPCKSEMPYFDAVYADVKDTVQFMMVDSTDGQRETVEKGKKYIAESGYSFPVYFDVSMEAGNVYGIRSIPTTIFIDTEGYVVTGAQGAIDGEMLRKGIDLLINTKTVQPPAEYHKISAEDAKKMLDENADAMLLDVRTEAEYNDVHIPNALLIPDYEIESRAEAELTDKNAAILIYCRSGNRSRAAANVLVSMGYTNVYDFGGISSWKYETE